MLSVGMDHLVPMQHVGHSQLHEQIELRFGANPEFRGIPVWSEKRDKCHPRMQQRWEQYGKAPRVASASRSNFGDGLDR